MVKKFILITCVLVLGAALFFISARILTGEDVWLCQNGQWVKHGSPSSPMPTTGCGQPQNVFVTEKGNADIIKIKKPLPDESISSPLLIEGEARGNWYFEANFPVKLLDGEGHEIAAGIVQAQGDWMTEAFVPFYDIIQFAVATSTNGTLVFIKDNPSGLPENSDELRIPVKIPYPFQDAGPDAMTVKVFLNNSKMDPEFSCNKVFPVERKIAKTQAPGRAALELLLSGAITVEEKNAGFHTSIPPGVQIQKLTIENGTAKVDFNEALEFQVGGSCWVSAIRAQITETLKQFPTVQNVIISINGRTEDILQP